MARLEEFPSVSETILFALLRDEPGALGAACTPLNESTIDKYYDWNDGTCFQARTLLQLAVTFSAGRCSAALLQGGADPNLKSPTDGKTALHCACLKGLSPASINLIAYLLRHGGNVSIADFSGSIPTDLLIKMNENK
jgi:ankyrin repeat protein